MTHSTRNPCASCNFRSFPDAPIEHCYMFKKEPPDRCGAYELDVRTALKDPEKWPNPFRKADQQSPAQEGT